MAKSDVLVRMTADTKGYDANIAKARRQLDQFKNDNLSMGGVLKQMNSSLVATAAKFASVTAAIGAIGSAFRNNIETARGFEKSMSQLSSLTGMVGSDLNKLKEYSIELGASTTLSASQVADAFKLIGSQQPQLLQSGEALKEVTKNAITLAEAAGIELADAAKTLSVSINQMGGDSNNAERYINVLAAASQKGAGDIVWLGEAITKSGTTAKAVGTDYEELVANLEQLAKAGYDASTAGTALRSIIMNLEKQANSQFKPSVVGLTQAFENLGKANLTLTQYQEIAGKMFAAQAKALADAAGEAKNMQEQITGTNIAEEQAKTNTDNLDGSLKSLASAWEGLNLHINSSNGLLRDVVDWLKDVVTWADRSYQKLESLYSDYGWMFNPSKEGARDSFVQVAGNKYGWVPDNVDDNGNYIKTTPAPAPQAGNTPAPVAPVSPTKTPKGKTTKNYEVGSLAYQEQLVQNLTKKWKEAGEGVRDQYLSQLVAAEAKLKKIKEEQELLKANMEGKLLGNTPDGGSLQTSNLGSVTGSQLSQKITGLAKDDLPQVLSPLQQMNAELERLRKNLDYAPNTEAYQAGLQAIADKEKEIANFKGMGSLSKDAKSTTESFRQAAGSISQVSNALASIDDPAAKIMGTIGQAIATIAMAYSEALAKDKTNKSNIWYFIATAAAMVTSMATTISAIHSATGYAEGGVVQGNTYSNDQMPAMLNAGEVVLTKAMAGNLASQIQEGERGGGSYKPSYISGEQIWLVLNHYTKRSGKGEIATWR